MRRDPKFIACFVRCYYCDVEEDRDVIVLSVCNKNHGYVACDLCVDKAEADREIYMRNHRHVSVCDLIEACSFLEDARFQIPRTNGSTTPGGVIRSSANCFVASKTPDGWTVPVEFNEDGSDAGKSGEIFKVVKLESLDVLPAQLVEILAFLNSQVA